jgi:LDH2 family malate/lactate/ureidoglycolate dehydrogenase
VVKEISPNRIHLTIVEARSLGEAALRKFGYDETQTRVICDHVIDAALCGYEYSGLPKILNLPEHKRFNMPRTPIKTLRETPVSRQIDGGNHNGMYVLYEATLVAIEIAKASGIAVVGVTNTWVSGRSAHYIEKVAKEDLAGILMLSSSRAVAPMGGTTPVFGTNPIAFGVPSARGPVIFDMGTSAFMQTELYLRERRGQELPDGVGIDAHGRPSRDPTAVKLGALLPFGGHKGYGLAFMMQAFGVLAGSGLDPEKDNAYLFIVFKPELLMELEQFKREVTELVDRVKNTPRQPGVEEIRIPSERAFRERERLSREGIVIDKLVYDLLSEL